MKKSANDQSHKPQSSKESEGSKPRSEGVKSDAKEKVQYGNKFVDEVAKDKLKEGRQEFEKGMAKGKGDQQGGRSTEKTQGGAEKNQH